ncbi:DegT/DnrJ/EryC1/StrS aminotransferase family protein [Alphaproteobacteria bacterium]|nr:DegT/DnrJ/EryC1/StrS aminotransferase family protein [Alphaproteobacteria bacterium]
MLSSQFSPWPSYSEEEADAVKRVLLSNKVNYWTGDECRQFENEYASFTNCNHAIAVANGTVALDLALKVIDLSPGDEIIVTSRTFLATVSSIVNAGLRPVFADVDKKTQNIDAGAIKGLLTEKTRAIMCVHFAGWPCDMDPILTLARSQGLYVIEDCAQAHGAVYKGKPVGSLGDIGCWSFCQDKIITTGGEGGMVTTNDSDLWSKMWAYKDHGKSWESVNKSHKSAGFRWLHDSFGTNWRMTEMQAVIGRIQLKRMPDWHYRRNKFLKQIWAAANEVSYLHAQKFSCLDCDGSCSVENACHHAAYKCYVFLDISVMDRDAVIKTINDQGVPCYHGGCSEVYLEKAFDQTGLRPVKRLPVAKQLGDSSLMFLCHPTLTENEVQKTCDVIKKLH